MKKPIILFVVLFALALSFFTMLERDEMAVNAAIEKAPGYAVVTPEGITKKTKKGRSTFQVNYSYQVNGAKYTFDTAFMEEAEAMALAETAGVQVAFPAASPATAKLKSDFDKRERDYSFMGALMKAMGFSFFVALIGSAVLVYRISWFRRA